MPPATTRIPLKIYNAKVTSKGQVTIPTEARKLLGIKTGDKLSFEQSQDGEMFVRKAEEFPFDRFRGMGTGIPELDNGNIDDIVRWLWEARGHDDVDDLILGTDRFGAGH